jgi:hypothetical protein
MLHGASKEWMVENRWIWDHDVIPPSYGGLFGGLMQFEAYGLTHVQVMGRCIVTRQQITIDVRLHELDTAFETRDIRKAWPKATLSFYKWMETGISEDDAAPFIAFRRYVRPCWCAKNPNGDCGTEPCVFCEMKHAAPEDDSVD